MPESSGPPPRVDSKKWLWRSLKIEPRRLVITADKPKAVFKVENRWFYDAKVLIKVPDGKLEITFGDGSKSKPEEPKTVLPRETIECHLNLTSSELEKLKTEELTDQEIRVECMYDVRGELVQMKDQMELIKVVFSDKELTKEEKEAAEKRKEEDKVEEERWMRRRYEKYGQSHGRPRPGLGTAALSSQVVSKQATKKPKNGGPATASHSTTASTTGTASTVTPTTTSTPGITTPKTPEEVEEEKKQKKCIIM